MPPRDPSLPPARSGVPTRRTRGSASDPSGENLPPAHERRKGPIERLRQRYPAKRFGITVAEREEVTELTLANMDSMTPAQIGVMAGRGVDSRPVKEVIKSARERMQRRAEEYADIHFEAAKLAAADGDAKPAQWALERISEGGARVVDSPKGGGGSPRSFKIGIALGGVPHQRAAGDLPVLTETTIAEAEILPRAETE